MKILLNKGVFFVIKIKNVRNIWFINIYFFGHYLWYSKILYEFRFIVNDKLLSLNFEFKKSKLTTNIWFFITLIQLRYY